MPGQTNLQKQMAAIDAKARGGRKKKEEQKSKIRAWYDVLYRGLGGSSDNNNNSGNRG